MLNEYSAGFSVFKCKNWSAESMRKADREVFVKILSFILLKWKRY